LIGSEMMFYYRTLLLSVSSSKSKYLYSKMAPEKHLLLKLASKTNAALPFALSFALAF
jgi:hypothetical protein